MIRFLSRLLRRLFGCSHDGAIRQRDKFGYHLVCDCGYRETLKFGEPKKIAKLKQQMRKPAGPAKVLPMRRAK